MRKNIPHIAWLLCLVFGLAACEKIEPDFYDEGANGAYFDYEYATDFDQTLNFADHIVGNPDIVSIPLKLKLLGYLKEDSRTLAIKTRPIEGYALADVTIDEVTFSDNEYEKTIEVKVRRPEMEDSTFAVCIYLDGTGDLGTGISGKDAVNLLVMESYEKPVSVWYSHVETNLGAWSKGKHIFLAKHTGNNQYYENLYDNKQASPSYDSSFDLNVSAVNALLADEPTEPINVDLPILKESDYPDYRTPYFWSLYEEQLGMYRANKFCRFTTLLGGSNTRDIAALYASEAGQQKMQEEAPDFHKDDVLYMLDEYYAYAQQGIALAEYKERCWVEMQNDKVYTLRIPYWWEDPDGLGTAAVVKKYFDEYNEAKYQFMLTTMMAVDSSENFMAASLFPFVKESDRYVWDDTPFGQEQLSGEERLKKCYRIIKAKYDSLPKKLKERYGKIPDVELET